MNATAGNLIAEDGPLNDPNDDDNGRGPYSRSFGVDALTFQLSRIERVARRDGDGDVFRRKIYENQKCKRALNFSVR